MILRALAADPGDRFAGPPGCADALLEHLPPTSASAVTPPHTGPEAEGLARRPRAASPVAE